MNKDLSLQHPSPSNRNWKLLRATSRQTLPVRFCAEPERDIDLPAIQAYGMGLVGDAARYIELRRLSCRQDDPAQWRLRLMEAMLLLELGSVLEAWHHLQLALSWRRQVESSTADGHSIAAITIREWLLMATLAIGYGETEVAEAWACEAVALVEKNPTCGLGDVLQDTRGDVMTVFAMLRLAQGRLQEADLLLDLAYDAHVQAGDVEQMAMDLMLLSDVELHSGDGERAMLLLFEVDRIVIEELDASRHLRRDAIRDGSADRLSLLRQRRPFGQLSVN